MYSQLIRADQPVELYEISFKSLSYLNLPNQNLLPRLPISQSQIQMHLRQYINLAVNVWSDVHVIWSG